MRVLYVVLIITFSILISDGCKGKNDIQPASDNEIFDTLEVESVGIAYYTDTLYEEVFPADSCIICDSITNEDLPIITK